MQLTTNYNFKKPAQTDNVNVDDLNYNMDIADAELKKVNEHLGEMEKQLSNYNSYASVKDGNGIFTVVEFKRPDGTLYMKSTLSGGTSPNYTADTWEFYNTGGVEIIKTIVWTITYDSDGVITSKVVLS